MTYGTIMGIDPGKKGAIVTIDFYPLAKNMDGPPAPVVRAWAADKQYIGEDGEYYLDTMAAVIERCSPSRAYVEQQLPFHKTPKNGCFQMGVGFGMWQGILAATNIRHHITRPQEWQKVVYDATCTKEMGKARGVMMARKRIPGLNLVPIGCRNPHDGIADAACIAMFGAIQAGFTWEQIFKAIQEDI